MTLIRIINDRNNGSITHEVLDADEDMDSGDMLAAADRTSTAQDDTTRHSVRIHVGTNWATSSMVPSS